MDSTSDELVRRVVCGERLPMAVVSRVQKAGRGRRGRAWASPEGGLWMSVGVESGGPMGGALALRLGLAICEVLDAAVGVRARVKWPNDVLVDGRKLAGVLCERRVVGDGHVLVVGIGMNVNNEVSATLPDGVARRAVCLAALCGGPVDVGGLAGGILERVEPVMRSAEAELDAEDLSGVLDRLHGLDGPISLRCGDGSRLAGELAGIAPDGRVALRDAHGLVRLVAEGELCDAPGAQSGGDLPC